MEQLLLRRMGKYCMKAFFSDMGKTISSKVNLTGSGETAAQVLAKNGVAIKISQDGTIKFFADSEKICY